MMKMTDGKHELQKITQADIDNAFELQTHVTGGFLHRIEMRHIKSINLLAKWGLSRLIDESLSEHRAAHGVDPGEEDGELYPLCNPQPAQVDCRIENCRHSGDSGHCHNIAPALTLNPDGTFVCWSDPGEEAHSDCISKDVYEEKCNENSTLHHHISGLEDLIASERSANKGLHTQIARYQTEMDDLRHRNAELGQDIPREWVSEKEHQEALAEKDKAWKERENLALEQVDRLENRNAKLKKELSAYKSPVK